MGTRSKLIIRRRSSSKPDIHLWMHWDGYFDGVGNDLVNQITLMLAKYSPEKIREMIIAAHADEDGEPFDPDHLIEFLEGSIKYFFNDCDDIEYKYILDADYQTLVGKHCCTGDIRCLTFEDMKMGKNFDDFSYDSDDDVVEDSDEEEAAVQGHMTVKALIAQLQKIVKENPAFGKKRVWCAYDGTCEPVRKVKVDIGNKYGYEFIVN